MKNDHPLEFLDYSQKNDFGYTYKNQYRMLIFSSHMCNRLSEIGVIPNKSLSLKFSDSIPEEYMSDYIRGIFDGDGSIGVKSLDNYKGSISISITSTFYFCNKLRQILLEKFDINSVVREASNHNNITASLYIDKNKDKKRFLDWIYKGAKLYLKRKHDIYIHHYGLDIDNSLVV